MITRNALSAVLVCALLLTSVAVSRAYASTGFAIEHYSLSATNEDGSADAQAGSHPYELVAEAGIDSEAQSASEVRNLAFELPPGLSLDPNAVPRCTFREFTEGSCPDGTAVGALRMRIAGTVVSATMYNLVPAPEQLGQLGFTFEGIGAVADVAVRTGGDYGMTVSIRDIPHRKVESVELTLGGVPYSAFLTLPTSCAGAPQTTLEGESWGAEAASQSFLFPQMTGCERVSFEPSIDVAPEVLQAGEPTGYLVNLHVPEHEEPAGLASAELKNAAVTLPEGAAISLSAADGLRGCSEGQIGLGSPATATCPEASKIGEVEIKTPLSSSLLEGSVYLASPNANPFGALLALYLVAEGGGVLLKLDAEVKSNPATGQLTIVLHELPQLPIGGLNLRFFGGARALLSNPPVCGLATTTSELTPWSALQPEPDATASSSFELTTGANGTPCSEPQPFNPAFRVASTTNETGAYDSLAFVVSRADQEEDLSTIAVQAPPAVGEMFTGVPPCGEVLASEGACPTTSQVGTVELAVGPGPDPYYLSGNVYLTGPYRGEMQGLSIVVAFDAGPFRLGTVVVRGAEQIDPGTGQLSILSDPLPTIVDGIPVQLKALALQLARGEFRLNPDGCESDTVTGTITSTRGGSLAIPTDLVGASPSQCNPPHTEPSVATPEGDGISSSIATASTVGTRITTTNDGKATVELTCTGTGTCRGKLILTIEMRSRRKGKRTTTTIGTAAFSIPAGKTAAIRLTLDAHARALLGAPGDRGRLSATLTVLEFPPAPSRRQTENVQLVRQKTAEAKSRRK